MSSSSFGVIPGEDAGINRTTNETINSLQESEPLKKFILPIKHRLYDFPRQNYISEWELNNCEEHRRVIGCLKTGDGEGAARILKDEHWSFEYQQAFIYSFYGFDN